MHLCPCNSQKIYLDCCGQYIENNLNAKTPEALMRSRYSAYSQGLVDYIERTMKGKPLTGFDKAQAKQWAQSVKWLGLEVLDATPVKKGVGFVEFVASYEANGRLETIHERSKFELIKGKWYYTDAISSKFNPK